MNFNNNIISLMNANKTAYYKIFFSSESHLIVFPELFKEEFNKATNNICQEDETSKFLYCNNLFNLEDYISMKLIDDNMTITIEVDNLNRFSSNTQPEQKHKTRIRFDNKIEFFIFPLIMFKNFHVQFDSIDNKISFYTTNKTILELKKEEEEDSKRQEPENDSSNTGTIILIIVIILLILVLGFGVFWFIKKRRSADKNINKYNKFEDEENFQNMDEKRVF